ncbi:YqcC family protein [SAR92 clade bacterium H921]|nr:YqcC family protein [SAR92 clade bacterium H921]
MIDGYHELSDLLLDVEKEMHRMELWQSQSPSPQALASVEPFAIDQLSFSQWLQFLFLPRMRELIESGAPLPKSSSIAPMAEEFFKAQNAEAAAIILKLAAIDQLISTS